MTDTTFEAIAMTIYFVAMIMIGLWAYVRTSDLDDYMLAGRDLNPFFGYAAVCFASPLAWICADAFLVPTFFKSLRSLKIRSGMA